MLIRWTTGLLKHRHWSDQQKWRPAYRWPARRQGAAAGCGPCDPEQRHADVHAGEPAEHVDAWTMLIKARINMLSTGIRGDRGRYADLFRQRLQRGDPAVPRTAASARRPRSSK